MLILHGCVISFLILPFLLLILPTTPDNEDPQIFDYIMLTREWPFTFCNVVTCTNTDLLRLTFNIHGLWAEKAENASKSLRDPAMFCPNVTFNESELVALRAELDQNWTNLKNPNGSAVKFWKAEFYKHGSCVATDARYNSTYLYFKAALQLNAQYDLIQMLANASIKPGADLINSSDIRIALQNAFGFDAGVRCVNQSGKTFLYELRLCFTKDLQPMGCGEQRGYLPNQPATQPPQIPEELPEQEEEEEHFLLSWFRMSALGTARQPLRIRHPPGRRRTLGGIQPRQQPDMSVELTGSGGTYPCREGEMVLMPDSL